MIFKDRTDAGKQLAERLAKEDTIKFKDKIIVCSILRGGAVVGREVATRLRAPHFFLIVSKISHPHQEELAIGAVCGDAYFLDRAYSEGLTLSKTQREQQIKQARQKQKKYAQKFIKKEPNIKGKVVIVVDDGVATGASVYAAARYLKNAEAEKIILAIPVAPFEFAPKDFDQVVVLHKAENFHAVSQFYQEFHQVRDEELLKMVRLN